MSAVPIAQTVPDNSRSTFFWIKRDNSSFARWVRGSITLTVPLDCHDAFLSSECEDWCLDNLTDGMLAEWHSIELRAHFASESDASLFKLRWL